MITRDCRCTYTVTWWVSIFTIIAVYIYIHTKVCRYSLLIIYDYIWWFYDLYMIAHGYTWWHMIVYDDIVCLRDFAILQYRNTLSFVILFECIVPESTRCPSNPEEDLENSAAWHANSSWTKAGDTAASSSLMLAMLVFAAQLRCTFSEGEVIDMFAFPTLNSWCWRHGWRNM